jgi:hypothetical protein
VLGIASEVYVWDVHTPLDPAEASWKTVVQVAPLSVLRWIVCVSLIPRYIRHGRLGSASASKEFWLVESTDQVPGAGC